MDYAYRHISCDLGVISVRPGQSRLARSCLTATRLVFRWRPQQHQLFISRIHNVSRQRDGVLYRVRRVSLAVLPRTK
jgi:hypothetical protein